MAKRVFNESEFCRRPPPEKMPVSYRLKRIPPEGANGLIILSHDVVGAMVHYSGGRTRCCLGEDCEADHQKCRIEWRGYCFVYSPKKQEVLCIEVTPAAMAPIDQAFREYRSLRGCKINFQRRGNLKNGQLASQVFAPAKNLNGLPEAPSLRKFLCRVWQVEYFKDSTVTTDEMIETRVADDVTLRVKSA